MGGKELELPEVVLYKKGFEEGKVEGKHEGEEERKELSNKIKKLELEIEQLKNSI